MNTAPVTVTHISLSKDIHRTLMDALKTEEGEWGISAETVNARRYLHYRWLVEGNPHSVDNVDALK